MQQISYLSDISPRFDAYLFDLWGVIHDGEHLYPGVLEMLETLHEEGKKVVFLSNAPRLAVAVTSKLKQLGVKREWYEDALTSGEAAHRYLQTLPSRRFHYQGLESDNALLEGIPQKRVQTLEEADFILNGNFDFHGQKLEKIMPRLKEAQERKLSMLCINPDLEVVKHSGMRIQCAGYLAARYEEIGGKVEYIGKPYPLVYQYALEMLGNPDLNRTLMVGDNPLTDIRGGRNAGIPTLLLTQGVLKDEMPAGQTPQQYCRELGIEPDYILDSFANR